MFSINFGEAFIIIFGLGLICGTLPFAFYHLFKSIFINGIEAVTTLEGFISGSYIGIIVILTFMICYFMKI